MIVRILAVLHRAGCLERWQVHYAVFFLSKFSGMDVSYRANGDVSVDGLDDDLERLEDVGAVSAGSTVCLDNDDLGEKAYDAVCELYGCSPVDRAVEVVRKLGRREYLAAFACFGYGACSNAAAQRLSKHRIAVAYLLYRYKLADGAMISKVAGIPLFKLVKLFGRV